MRAVQRSCTACVRVLPITFGTCSCVVAFGPLRDVDLNVGVVRNRRAGWLRLLHDRPERVASRDEGEAREDPGACSAPGRRSLPSGPRHRAWSRSSAAAAALPRWSSSRRVVVGVVVVAPSSWSASWSSSWARRGRPRGRLRDDERHHGALGDLRPLLRRLGEDDAGRDALRPEHLLRLQACLAELHERICLLHPDEVRHRDLCGPASS